MNTRDKVLLLTFIGLISVIAMVMSHPVEDTDTPTPQIENQGHQHGHRRGWGGGHWRGDHSGCKHKSGDGNWHHHHNHEGGNREGGWHHHNHGHHHGPPPGWSGNNNENHRGEASGVPANPLGQNPQGPIVGQKQPESGYIVPTTPGQRPIQQHNPQENIDDTIDNIFKPNTANRVDDTIEPIRPLVDVRDGEIAGRPAGVPSISDLVLAGDFSNIK